MREKDPVFRTLSDVKKFLNEGVEKILHEKLTWNTLEEIVVDTLHRRIEDVVYSALGFELESGYRGTHWKLKDYGDDKFTIPKLIRELAEDVAEKNFKKWVKALLPALDAAFNTRHVQKTIVQQYKEAVNRAMWKRLERFVEEKAAADIEALFDRKAEKFLEEVRLQHPIRLNDIRQLADDPEDE